MNELAISVSHVRKRYRDTVALDDVTFDVSVGERVGLLGANGAGKSTTVSVIAGLTAPDSGEVRVRGMDPRRRGSSVRQVLGVQLQQARFHELLTVTEIIDLYRSFYSNPRDTDDLIRLVKLEQKRSTRFAKLSGGQQQRLSVAVALVGRPKVVILDELTTGLDPASRRSIWAVIESMVDESFLIVSHAMDEVERLCSRVLVLDRGRVIAEGTPAQLMEKTGAATLDDAFVALTGERASEFDGDES